MPLTYYTLRDDGDQYRVTKFDSDLNVESSYLMSPTECTCPAGVRPTCRHRQMFPDLVARINTNWLWNFEARLWIAGPASEDQDGPADILTDPDTDLEIEEDDDGDIPNTGEDETGAAGAPSNANTFIMFQCPCGKDIADDTTEHAVDCERRPSAETLASDSRSLTPDDLLAVRTPFQSWRRI